MVFTAEALKGNSVSTLRAYILGVRALENGALVQRHALVGSKQTRWLPGLLGY